MKFSVRGQDVFASTGGKAFDPTLPTVLFVHGAGMDHSVWQQQARYFAHHGYGVLAVDLPGHGISDGGPIADIQGVSDWIVDAIDAVGVDSASIVGHSMGALAALEAAARHPGKIGRIALLGVAAKMPVHPDLLAAANANDPKAFELIADWGHGARAHRGGNIASGIWLIQTGTRLLEQAAPGVLANDLAASDAYSNALKAAALVRCPALCVLGGHDKMTPVKAAAALVEALPEVEQTVLPGSGHMMMVEAPGETLDVLVGFLRG